MLLALEGDPDALDIPTPRSYAVAIEGPYSSQWQAAMDAEMASWKSTCTYIDEVPLPGANIAGLSIPTTPPPLTTAFLAPTPPAAPAATAVAPPLPSPTSAATAPTAATVTPLFSPAAAVAPPLLSLTVSVTTPAVVAVAPPLLSPDAATEAAPIAVATAAAAIVSSQTTPAPPSPTVGDAPHRSGNE
ncbi:unnamed protein product [Closterium sp. NIES-54]